MGFDGLAEYQTQDNSREKGNQHIEGKLLGLSFCWQVLQGDANFLPVHQNDGKNGTGLNGDVKHFGLCIHKPQQ
jgi:hypothetical protein